MKPLPATGKQVREVRFDRAAVNVDGRTVELSFASDTPVDRWDPSIGEYREVLGMDASQCDLSRLNTAAPLLVCHDTDDQVGVIERAWIDPKDNKARATVRFSKSQRAQEIFQDVIDGIRSLVSVGYRVNSLELVGVADGVETYLATSWQPYEVSLVSVPADTAVGVGRSAPTNTTATREPNKSMSTDIAPAAAPVITTAPATAPNHSKAIRDCADAFKKHNNRDVSDIALSYIGDGKTVEEFQRHLLTEVMGAKPVTATSKDPFEAGLSKKEVRQFSVLRAIQSVCENGRVGGFEKEVSDSIRTHLKNSPGSTDKARAADGDGARFFIPTEVSGRMNRALNAQTATAGEVLIQTNVYPEMIELLRNNIVVQSLGARQLSDLVGDILIPSLTGAQTAYWLGAGAQVSQSQQTFGQVTLQPRRLAASVPYDKQLIAQSSFDVEGLIREDAMEVVARAIDLAALFGTGAGQPLGIANMSGRSTDVTFGAAADWNHVVQFESNIATSNALNGKLAYVVSPATRGKWKTNQKATNYPAYLMDSDGTVNGYKTAVTTQIPTATGTVDSIGHRVFFGNWADFIIAMWSGIEMIVDPYTLKRNGQIEVTTQVFADCAARHAKSFVCSADSGAQ